MTGVVGSLVLSMGAAVLVACGGGKPLAAGGFPVALLTPGPVSDQSWNAGAYAGLLRIRDSLGATVSNVQTKTPAEFEENFRQYGSAGYALVIGHGFEFQDAAARVGPEFPSTIYVTTGGDVVGRNVASLSFAFDEPSYLAGMIAAGVSGTGNLGCIGGSELPPVKSAFDAFTAGARSINPKINVVISYLGTWDDAGAGKEQALAQIGRDIDVIFQDADAAGLGVFQAARESKRVRVIGSNSDQNALAPEVTLGSVVIDIPSAFLLVAREVKDGHFKPRIMRLGTRDGAVRWVPNPTPPSVVPANVARGMDSVGALMRAGTFAIPAASAAK